MWIDIIFKCSCLSSAKKKRNSSSPSLIPVVAPKGCPHKCMEEHISILSFELSMCSIL